MILLKIKKSTKLKLIVIVINIHFDDYGQYSGRQSSLRGLNLRDDECECRTLVSINANRYAYAHGFHLGPHLMVIKLTAKCNPLFTM